MDKVQTRVVHIRTSVDTHWGIGCARSIMSGKEGNHGMGGIEGGHWQLKWRCPINIQITIIN